MTIVAESAGKQRGSESDPESMSADFSPVRARLAAAVTAAAIVTPTLVVHWVVTGYAVFAQLVAAMLWGLSIAAWAGADRSSRTPWRALAPLLAALGLTAIGIGATWWRVQTIPGPIVCAIGLLVVSAAVAATAARVAGGPLAMDAERGLVGGLAVAATLGTLIGAVQVLAPSMVDGLWIARTHSVGRAGANLLQPNHLSSLLIWALLAVLFALEHRWFGRRLAAAAALFFVLGLALTASRGGLITLILLAAWALADRRLSATSRTLLFLAPVVCLLSFWALPHWLPPSDAARAASDLARSGGGRSGVYAGAAALIAEYPWLGIGWDEFGLAWAMAPQTSPDGRPFDNAHNLVLNLLVELGIPLGLAIVGCLIYALRRVWRDAMPGVNPGDPANRFALAMLATIGLHSMVEMPLWFAYFLLPTAWIWGSAVGRAAQTGANRQHVTPAPTWQPWLPIGLGMAVTTFIVFADFTRALPASLPPAHPMPLTERVAHGRESRLFHQFADHLAATTLPNPPLSIVQSARHVVIDRALMGAWAQALEGAGRIDEARYLGARLRMAGLAPRANEAPPSGDGEVSPSSRAVPDRTPDWRNLR